MWTLRLTTRNFGRRQKLSRSGNPRRGLVSNTPLQWVVDDEPRQDTLAFHVDLWSARGEFPGNMLEVMTRERRSAIPVARAPAPISSSIFRSCGARSRPCLKSCRRIYITVLKQSCSVPSPIASSTTSFT
jgi:predicted acylesterase/phospholipase RssA